MPTASDYERLLRAAALRVTRPRVAVLAAVTTTPHADTDSIIGAVRHELGDVSHQAVYDVLRALTDRGSGAPHPAGRLGGPLRVARRRQPSPRRLPSCGAIADVDCAVGATPCLTASDDHGFAIDEAEVIYWGLCPDCSVRTEQSLSTVTDPERIRHV